MDNDLSDNLFHKVARQDQTDPPLGRGEGSVILFETIKMASYAAHHLLCVYLGSAQTFKLAEVYIVGGTRLLNRRPCFHFRDKESITVCLLKQIGT